MASDSVQQCSKSPHGQHCGHIVSADDDMCCWCGTSLVSFGIPSCAIHDEHGSEVVRSQGLTIALPRAAWDDVVESIGVCFNEGQGGRGTDALVRALSAAGVHVPSWILASMERDGGEG